MKHFLDALRQRHLSLSFAAAGSLKVEIYECPGLWMEPQRLEALSEALRQIARATLGEGKLRYGVFSGDPRRMSSSIVTLVRDLRSGRPIAFNALALMQLDLPGDPVQVIHLGLVMVDPGERQKGLSWILYGLTCVLLLARAGFRPLTISNVTQVPAVVGMVGETFSNVFPTPSERKPRDFRKVLMAREIMARHRQVFGVGPDALFDEDRFVITNAYTGGSDDLKKSFREASKHRDATYNDLCADLLDYDRGDDILQIGQIDPAAAGRYVSRSVPAGSVAHVAALAALVLVQRAILPVAHWFNSTERFGMLRPR